MYILFQLGIWHRKQFDTMQAFDLRNQFSLYSEFIFESDIVTPNVQTKQ